MSIETRRTLAYFEGPRPPFSQGPTKSNDSGAGLSSAIRFPLLQLSRLSLCEIKIGPLTCREWSTHLNNWFIKMHRNNPIFSKHYADIISYFAADNIIPANIHADSETMIRHSLRDGFTTGFHYQVAKATGLSENQLFVPALVYIQLKELAVKVSLRRQEQKPFDDLLATNNGIFKKICGHDPLEVVA